MNNLILTGISRAKVPKGAATGLTVPPSGTGEGTTIPRHPLGMGTEGSALKLEIPYNEKLLLPTSRLLNVHGTGPMHGVHGSAWEEEGE